MPYVGAYHCYMNQLQSKEKILQIAEIAKQAPKKLAKQGAKCRIEELMENNGIQSSDDDME